jgi:hypothetical protein
MSKTFNALITVISAGMLVWAFTMLYSAFAPYL